MSPVRWLRAVAVIGATVLQFALWLAYLVIVLTIFLRPTKAPAKPDASPQPLTEAERSTT